MNLLRVPMKNILLVIENINESRTLLNKVASLSPDKLTILLDASIEEREIAEQVDKFSTETDPQKHPSITLLQADPARDLSSDIIQTAHDINADLTVLHKQIGRAHV